MSDDFEIDEELLVEAQKLRQHRTKREAVAAALTEYVIRRKQLEILELFGTIDYDPAYDYKRARSNRKSGRAPKRT